MDKYFKPNVNAFDRYLVEAFMRQAKQKNHRFL